MYKCNLVNIHQILRMIAIAVFTSVHATLKVVADYLTWAVDLERSLPESETPRPRRTALVVTKSDTIFSPETAVILMIHASATCPPARCEPPVYCPSAVSPLVYARIPAAMPASGRIFCITTSSLSLPTYVGWDHISCM